MFSAVLAAGQNLIAPRLENVKAHFDYCPLLPGPQAAGRAIRMNALK